MKRVITVRILEDVMRSALKRHISYLEALRDKEKYYDVMGDLCEEQEKRHGKRP